MRTIFILATIFVLYLSHPVPAQTNNHRWEPLIISKTQKIWYDASQLDSIKDNKLDIWILQMHHPPLTFSEIPQKIYRSQTLYSIDLNNAKYGIMKVRYYGVTNKLLYNFDYHIDKLPDNLKYTYPILDNSFLHNLITKLSKIERKSNYSNGQ